MDDIALQLDQVRQEIARLLSSYSNASTERKQEILTECDRLGGEVQELVGLLKLSIRKVLKLTSPQYEGPSAERDHLEQLAQYGLRVAHCAGEEVSAAIRLIRQLQTKQLTGEP